MNLTCQRCGASFSADHRRRKFCGVGCYRLKSSAQPSATAFQPGQSPWNKHLRGRRLSPSTEFKKGQPAHNKAPIGEVRVRVDKQGNPRAWVKISEPNNWQLRAVYAWTLLHGAPRVGAVIHHKDHDTLNDSPGNLQAITRREHLLHHLPEMEARRSEAIALSLRDSRAGQQSIFDVLGTP